MAELFRKASLERLASPEQLDKAIVISKPASWLALLGLSLIIIATLVWSFLGSLPSSIPVQGLSGKADQQAGQTISCYTSYLEASKIKKGMKATVKALDGDAQYPAKVSSIELDETELSDMELVLGSTEIIVEFQLELTQGTLPERTLVTAMIITEEIKPIDKLFSGLSSRLKG